MKLPRWFHLFGSPPFVYRLAGTLSPWLGVIACVLLLVGAYLGLFVVAADEVQVQTQRGLIRGRGANQAAYLAGIGAGYWSGEEEVAANWRIARRFEPGPGAAAAQYCAAMPGSMAELNATADEAQNDRFRLIGVTCTGLGHEGQQPLALE